MLSLESASTMHRVLLDDRIVLTPQGRPLWTPSEALSYAVAAEWNMQKETITPHMMPLVRKLHIQSSTRRLIL